MHHARMPIFLALLVPVVLAAPARAVDLLPAADGVKQDHPRLLIRPGDTKLAVTLDKLRGGDRGKEFEQMLAQLRNHEGASTAAMAWLITDDKSDAETALARIRAWKAPDDKGNAFRVWFGCKDMALAYDWLYNYPGFTDALKAELREKVRPLAEAGNSPDHLYHNYTWMKNSGAALWAMATLGDDPKIRPLYDAVRDRFNTVLYPGMAYLAGQPGDVQGYWGLYCLAPGTFTLMAAQSAFDVDLSARVKADGGDWPAAQLETIAQATLPNLRYVPFGDMQQGPDGGVTHEMAANIDMLTWATGSPAGAWLSQQLAARRRAARFFGDTIMGYFLYTRNLSARPAEPPLSHLAGGSGGGHWFARSGWGAGDTVVAFRCTDHYTGHNHFDQGSFVIYHKGMLAADAGYYGKAQGSQIRTENHNTLLIGGQPQRTVRARLNRTLESYKEGLASGPRSFETGNILYTADKGRYAAVAGEFGQAYPAGLVRQAVRQILFIRPGILIVVDQLTAAGDKPVPEITWLLQFGLQPKNESSALLASDGNGWIRCRPLLGDDAKVSVVDGAGTLLDADGKADPTWRASWTWPEKAGRRTLVYLIQVGDGPDPGKWVDATVEELDGRIQITVDKKPYHFATAEKFTVSEK